MTDPLHSPGPRMRPTGKSATAYRTISEVSDELDIPQHVLRFWETKFNQVRPLKRGGGRRYYRPEDVGLLRRIQKLLYQDGYTIKGVQRLLRENRGEPHPALAADANATAFGIEVAALGPVSGLDAAIGHRADPTVPVEGAAMATARDAPDAQASVSQAPVSQARVSEAAVSQAPGSQAPGSQAAVSTIGDVASESMSPAVRRELEAVLDDLRAARRSLNALSDRV